MFILLCQFEAEFVCSLVIHVANDLLEQVKVAPQEALEEMDEDYEISTIYLNLFHVLVLLKPICRFIAMSCELYMYLMELVLHLAIIFCLMKNACFHTCELLMSELSCSELIASVPCTNFFETCLPELSCSELLAAV